MNITSLIHLFRAHFMENKKMLLICGIIAFGVQAFSFTVDAAPELSSLIPYVITFWVAGTFFQHSLKRNNSIHFFNLPVSAAEKLTYAVLFLVMFSAVMLILTYAGAYAGYYVIHPLLDTRLHPNRWELNGQPTIWVQLLPMLLYYFRFFAVFSVFLFGSIYFKKNSFWKTMVSTIGILLAFVGYYALILYNVVFRFFSFEANAMYSLTDNAMQSMNIQGNNVSINAEGLISFHTWHDIGIYGGLYANSAFSIVLIMLFLTLTYLRLKETEV